MSFKPRFSNGVYRDCKWCGGKGCLACQGEADKEYRLQFPDGPKPIATFQTDGTQDGLISLVESLIGSEAQMDAKVTAQERAAQRIEEHPETVLWVQQLNPMPEEPITERKVKDALAHSLQPEILIENIVKKSDQA